MYKYYLYLYIGDQHQPFDHEVKAYIYLYII